MYSYVPSALPPKICQVGVPLQIISMPHTKQQKHCSTNKKLPLLIKGLLLVHEIQRMPLSDLKELFK